MAATTACECAGADGDPLHDVPAIAAHLAVSERFVRGQIAGGAIAIHRLSPKVIRVCGPALQAYLDACLVPAVERQTSTVTSGRPLKSVPAVRTRSTSRARPTETPWNRRVAA
ncbi:MAG TPA: hypothetical protein DHV14_13985 [Micrococcales bacterium]|uniref:hypothetical protein n=1 Tax=Miniimonas arenae TaxID=676201 RepID=UPI000EDFF560|nr:hypothetical protein [Miniimonas arenae]HCX86212.1 hypothetical protein [Micrococcales bacterium]